MKRTRIRPVSAKRRRANAERRRVIERLVAERGGRCEWFGCPSEAHDAHELKSRARSGSITSPDNIVLICRWHHNWITEHPAEALRMGWLVSSWDEGLVIGGDAA